MEVFTTTASLQNYRSSLPHVTDVGFVPTMGALHQGHLSLVEASITKGCHTGASIFVNPAQFGPNEDLEKYPRTLEADLEKLQAAGVHFVFVPESPSEIYKSNADLTVDFPRISARLEGAIRPGHFAGVALVVTKLFNLFRPHVAFFGQKDFQQTVVIRKLIEELFLQIKLVVVPTTREPDGLAMSSRNRYLNPEHRAIAPKLYQALQAARAIAKAGGNASACIYAFRASLAAETAFKLDYITVVNGNDLEEIDQLTPDQNPIAISAAALGTTRLLDNLYLLAKMK